MTVSSQSPLIVARDVSRSFTSVNGTVDAITSANFDIPDGSFTIVYGPSGSGKSTLLNCLVGLDAPTRGTVLYEGRNLYDMTANERAYFRAYTMGMVYQTSYWVKSLDVLENVALPLTFLGVSTENARKQAMTSLSRIDMACYAKKKVYALSGGEQQRVALARALVNNPSYIVADEPTGNLDSQAGDSVIELLRYFNQEFDRTVILVTHNMSYLPVGDQLLTINDGVVQSISGAGLQQATGKILDEAIQKMSTWKVQPS